MLCFIHLAIAIEFIYSSSIAMLAKLYFNQYKEKKSSGGISEPQEKDKILVLMK